MDNREAEITRKTQETEVKLYLNLDGKGKSEINTNYPFLNHMLSLFCTHGFFDMRIVARGDIEVDYHHLVEDVGICLGEAVKKALGEKRGIKRYGYSFVPMDEVMVQIAIDISGRPLLIFNLSSQFELAREFFRGFSSQAGITLHINLYYGEGFHHIMEATFKAFALSLDEATKIDKRREGIPSTKGRIEI